MSLSTSISVIVTSNSVNFLSTVCLYFCLFNIAMPLYIMLHSWFTTYWLVFTSQLVYINPLFIMLCPWFSTDDWFFTSHSFYIIPIVYTPNNFVLNDCFFPFSLYHSIVNFPIIYNKHDVSFLLQLYNNSSTFNIVFYLVLLILDLTPPLLTPGPHLLLFIQRPSPSTLVCRDGVYSIWNVGIK